MARDKVEEEKRKPRRRRRASSGTADYAVVDANALRNAVIKLASTGGAIRFGYTSDGGAFAIGIYGDGEPYTEYIKPNEDLSGFLVDLAEEWE